MKAVSADGLDLLAEDSRDTAAWQARIERDRRRADAGQCDGARRATALILTRSIAAGAAAVALTGSTARGQRTATSDVDFHVIGSRPSLADVDVDVDVHATTAADLFARLRSGDDYAQWTLRFGCVMYDTGVLRAAALALVESARWPSPERKRQQVGRMLRVASEVLASGDGEAAVEQVRGVVTGLARWRLLAAGSFPLSRPELPEQLRRLGDDELASALERCIYAEPGIDELAELVQRAHLMIARADGARSPAAS